MTPPAETFVDKADGRHLLNAEAMYRQCVSYITELRAWGVSAEHMISKGVSKRLVRDAIALQQVPESSVQNASHRKSQAVDAGIPPAEPAMQPDTVQYHTSASSPTSFATPEIVASPEATAAVPHDPATHKSAEPALTEAVVCGSLSSVRTVIESQDANITGNADTIGTAVSVGMQANPSGSSSGSSMSLESAGDFVIASTAIVSASPSQRISITLPAKPISPVTRRSPPPGILSMQASIQKLGNKLHISLPPRPACVTTEPNAIQSNMRGFTDLEIREANVKAMLRRRAPVKKSTVDGPDDQPVPLTSTSESKDEGAGAHPHTDPGLEQISGAGTGSDQPSPASRASSIVSIASGNSAAQSSLDMPSRSRSPAASAEIVKAGVIIPSISSSRTPKRPLAFDFEEEPTSTLPLKLQQTTLRPFCTARSIETIFFDDDEESSHPIIESPYIAALRSNFRACRSALAIPSLTATTYRAPVIHDFSRASTPSDVHSTMPATPGTSTAVSSTVVFASRGIATPDTEQTKLAQTEAALVALKAKMAAIEEARTRKQTSQSAMLANSEDMEMPS